jgi:hypothetical protein
MKDGEWEQDACNHWQESEVKKLSSDDVHGAFSGTGSWV